MREFAERARLCTTENEWNRLHIDLENALVPQELAELARFNETAGRFKKTANWLAKLRRLSPGIIDAPRHYEEKRLHPNLTLYRGAPHKQGRQLLMAFAGNAGRVMLPTPVFLQLFDPKAWDVLIVRKQPGQSLYGNESELRPVAKTAAALCEADQYASTCCIGTSSGGFAAVMSAPVVGARSAISVGGRIPPAMADAFVDELAAELRGINVFCVHGAEFENDAASARQMAVRIGGEVVPVQGVARHNVLAGLLMDGGDINALFRRIGLRQEG